MSNPIHQMVENLLAQGVPPTQIMLHLQLEMMNVYMLIREQSMKPSIVIAQPSDIPPIGGGR